MIRIITELTDAELTRRIHKLEEHHHKLARDLSKILTQYRKDILFKKRTLLLGMYSEAINEAAYRGIITIH